MLVHFFSHSLGRFFPVSHSNKSLVLAGCHRRTRYLLVQLSNNQSV